MQVIQIGTLSWDGQNFTIHDWSFGTEDPRELNNTAASMMCMMDWLKDRLAEICNGEPGTQLRSLEDPEAARNITAALLKRAQKP